MIELPEDSVCSAASTLVIDKPLPGRNNNTNVNWRSTLIENRRPYRHWLLSLRVYLNSIELSPRNIASGVREEECLIYLIYPWYGVQKMGVLPWGSTRLSHSQTYEISELFLTLFTGMDNMLSELALYLHLFHSWSSNKNNTIETPQFHYYDICSMTRQAAPVSGISEYLFSPISFSI